MSTILARVLRNGTVESVHRGSIVALDCNGKKIASAGNPERVTFWRSAAKAFQAIPFVTSGASEAFGFSDRELALACASHSGEEMHTSLVAAMLARADFDKDSLKCGSHPPFDMETAAALIRNEIEPDQLHNNCSGKHAAMLAFAKHIGEDANTYLEPENRVQEAILETILFFAEIPAEEVIIGTDGCSAPNFAMPLSAMARAYGKLVKPPDVLTPDLKAACGRIIGAIMNHPELVGGRLRLDTTVMQALPGKIVCKVGAEGVWTVGVLPDDKWPEGLAFALKIDDGDDDRARPAVGIELLRRLKILTPEAEETLGEFSPQKLINRNGIEVGEVVADFELE